jgi:ribose 5-phosphate isomerase A
VDPQLDLIKGAGGALLREKIVAQASRREIIVIDESKMVPVLGRHRALPVEVCTFGWRTQTEYLQSLGARVEVRTEGDGSFFLTDQGSLILDCAFGPINQPVALAAQLDARAGIVGHGLFLGLATDVICAGAAGVRHLRRHQ